MQRRGERQWCRHRVLRSLPLPARSEGGQHRPHDTTRRTEGTINTTEAEGGRASGRKGRAKRTGRGYECIVCSSFNLHCSSQPASASPSISVCPLCYWFCLLLCLCYPLLLLLVRSSGRSRPPMSHWSAAICCSTSAASSSCLRRTALTADNSIQTLIQLRRHRGRSEKEKAVRATNHNKRRERETS